MLAQTWNSRRTEQPRFLDVGYGRKRYNNLYTRADVR